MATIVLYLSHQSTDSSVDIEHIRQDALTPSEQEIVKIWQQPDTIIQIIGYNGKVIYLGNYTTIVRQFRQRPSLRKFSKQPNYISPTPPVRG